MYQTATKWCVVFLLLLTLGSGRGIAETVDASSNTLVVRAALSMAMPASGITTEGEFVGFEVDLIRALFEDYDQRIDIKFSDAPNWKRSLENLRYGRLDLLTLVSFREDRLSYMDYIGALDTERPYLLTRIDVNLGILDTLDELALGKGFVALNTNISWNVPFEERLRNDAAFAANFTFQEAGQISAITDVERLQTSEEYRAQLASSVKDVYEDGSMSLEPMAERISVGSIGGAIIVDKQIAGAIQSQKERIMNGGLGKELKATQIKVFGTSSTYLAASYETAPKLRQYIKSRYLELRINGRFDEIWSKWYGDVEPPDYTDLNQRRN